MDKHKFGLAGLGSVRLSRDNAQKFCLECLRCKAAYGVMLNALMLRGSDLDLLALGFRQLLV